MADKDSLGWNIMGLIAQSIVINSKVFIARSVLTCKVCNEVVEADFEEGPIGGNLKSFRHAEPRLVNADEY